MKKVLGGMLGMAATIAVVVGVAFASFNPQVIIKGFGANTDNSKFLFISTSGQPNTFFSSIDLAQMGVLDRWQNLTPASPDNPVSFWLNNTGSTQLTVQGVIVADTLHATGNIADGLQVSIVSENTTPTITDWHTLNEWLTGRNISVNPLDPGTREYKIHVRLKDDANYSGSVSNIQFSFGSI